MISVKLKNGNITTLFPQSEDGLVYKLLDENGTIQIVINKEDNKFTWDDKQNVDEDDNTFRQKLDALYIQLESENTIGVENEEDDLFTDPFDPDEISINTKNFTMDGCLRRLTQGTIILNPGFQRQEVWTIDKKSRLIESLMLKIPIPMFYVSADENGTLTMVDGLQRFSTIRDFILGKKYFISRDEKDFGDGFKLKDLEFWEEYEGKTFKELPTHIVNRILETEFTFTVINPGTPEELRRNIFKRINTGGLPLSSQEIRNALYIGQATTLLNDLALLDVFKKATDFSIKDQRMEDKELILRFVSFLIRNFTSFNKSVGVDTWLSDTMIIVNALPSLESRYFKRQLIKKNATIDIKSIEPLSINSITTSFELAMERAHKLFKEHAFRKSYPGKRRTPINKSLFETWGVLLTEITEEQFDNLYKHKDDMMTEYKGLINDNDFVIIISRDSMKPASVRKRFQTISNLINTHSK